MSILNAILLGIVQGLTEFLPVSSSAHLSIIDNLFNMSTQVNGHLFFNVLLHFATMFSVFIVYWREIVAMVEELLAVFGAGPIAAQPRESFPSARMFLMLVMATLPLLLILPFKSRFDTLNNQNIFIGLALVLTGCVLYVADRMPKGRKSERTMSVLDAIIIGLCQCVAAIPGFSRTAVTVTAGIATGLRRDSAIKFTYLLSIPAVFGANVLLLSDAIKSGVNWSDMPAYLVGMAAALVTGVGAIYLFRYLCKDGKFGGFAYYCWVMGVLSIILTMIF